MTIVIELLSKIEVLNLYRYLYYKSKYSRYSTRRIAVHVRCPGGVRANQWRSKNISVPEAYRLSCIALYLYPFGD